MICIMMDGTGQMNNLMKRRTDDGHAMNDRRYSFVLCIQSSALIFNALENGNGDMSATLHVIIYSPSATAALRALCPSGSCFGSASALVFRPFGCVGFRLVMAATATCRPFTCRPPHVLASLPHSAGIGSCHVSFATTPLINNSAKKKPKENK